MKLYIDTSNSEKVTIKLDEKEFVADAKQERAQKLLPFILDTLESEGKKIEDIAEIEMNPGPGSFTGLRVGASVAQTLAWQLEILLKGNELKYS